MLKKRYSQVLRLFLIILIFGCASCFTNQVNPAQIGGPSGPQTGMLFVHAAAGYPPVDIYGNGTLMNPSPVPYGGSTPGYITLNTGDYYFNFDTAGTKDLIASVYEPILADSYFTTILYDSTNDSPRVVPIPDATSNTSLDRANIRFVDLCPNIQGMDVYFNGSRLFADREFLDCKGDYTLDTFIQVIGGSHYPVTLRYLNGLDSTSFSQSVYFNSGDIYTIIASGFNGDTDSTGLRLSVIQNY